MQDSDESADGNVIAEYSDHQDFPQPDQLVSDKLRAAINRVIERGGASEMDPRYDRTHHRHNKT